MALAKKALFLVPGALLGLSACGPGVADSRPPKTVTVERAPRSPADPAPLVETILAVRSLEGSLDIPSSLAVDRDVELMSRITGILEEIRVDRGHRVTQGQVLARLENRDLALRATSAEKSYRLAQAEFERARALSDTRVISQQDFDVRRLAAEKAEADWKLAQAELDKSFIRAPFDGIVSERYARMGQRVVEDGDAPLFRITALEPLLARFYLPEIRLGQVRLGDSVSIRIQADPNRSCDGRIRWISPVVDAASGTFQVIAEVKRPPGDSLLRPGLSVKVRLPLGAGPVTVLVRREALSPGETVTEGGPASLFVVEEGHARLRAVRVGKARGDQVEILAGLRGGEAVIRSFRADLADGALVRVVPPP